MVYPAAEIPNLAKQAGAKIVQINPGKTPLDAGATWSLRGPAGVVLPDLLSAAYPEGGNHR